MDVNMDSSLTCPTSEMSHKFLVFGDSQCGKSSILDYFCKETNQRQKISQTIGCDVHVKLRHNQKEKLNNLEYFEFWDFAEDSNSYEIQKAYLKGLEKDINNIQGLIYVYDASNIKTLFHIQKHLEGLASEILMLKGILGEKGTDAAQLPLLIIGNKSDLIDDHLKTHKLQIISDYIKGIFSDSKLNCIFVSNNQPYDQFKEVDQFLQDCISNNHKDLMFYSLGQKLYCYAGFTAYAKKKLNSLTQNIMRVQNYFSLKMFQSYTIGLAIAFTFKKDLIN